MVNRMREYPTPWVRSIGFIAEGDGKFAYTHQAQSLYLLRIVPDGCAQWRKCVKMRVIAITYPFPYTPG